MNPFTRFLLLLLLLQLMDFVLGAITEWLLLPEQLVLADLSERFTHDEITNVLKYKGGYSMIVWIIKGTLRLLNIIIIAGILSIGVLVNDFKVKWLRIVSIVTVAQFVFFIPLLLKLFWFSFVQTSYTYTNVKDFSVLSLYNLLDYAEDWQKGPLKQLNVFEILFWVFLAIGLKKLYNISLNNGMSIVAQSYGVSFLLWMTVIAFFSIM